MSKHLEKFPKTFTEFVGLVDKIQLSCQNSIWYRGCGDSSYKLIPSLYRHKSIKDSVDFAAFEHSLMIRFIQRSVPFCDKSITEGWDSFFFMQHYGVPTRLLDWTENPFIAFYFAVMSAKYKVTKKGIKFTSPASVWILDPVAWNRYALKHESYDKGVLSTPDEQLKGYKPAETASKINNLPVALNGIHNSSRIVAQRGVFTIFGRDKSSMEKIFERDKFPKNSLIKVTFKEEFLYDMKQSILNHGITESVVFPDLDGLAREIKREFKFKD